MREMEKGFSLFDEAWLAFVAQDPNIQPYAKVAAAIQVQHSAPVLFMKRKKELLLGHRWTSFFFFQEGRSN